MKLSNFRVTVFKSVVDSNVIELDRSATCLVGKNEAGKTAILRALYKLNPIRSEDGDFNATDDYPRVEVADYEDAVSRGAEPAQAVTATYELDDEEASEIELALGPLFLKSRLVEVSKYYDNERRFSLDVDEQEAIRFLCRTLPPAIQADAQKAPNAEGLKATLVPHAADPAVAAILPTVNEAASDSFEAYAFSKFIEPNEPKFLYFDEYYQLTGCENIEALQARVANGKLQPSDQPLLGLIELARLNLGQLQSPQRTQDLKNKLEGAGNSLTKQIMPYWSQNKHLQMRFDVRTAQPGDPEHMRTGTNIWGEIYDTKHFVSTGLGTRSRGFVWFFSFVAWYSQIKRRGDNVILLLDEPGLTLHGRAQGDLLRYFETELRSHQIIYTTHSPFMIDPARFERVRIVQDRSIDMERADELPRERQGTKVTRDIFDASDDSLFPLQGALGYDIHQTLFIGPNTLLVEGPADLLYLQGMSAVLAREGREFLSDHWTITPVGGAGRIPTFVRLLTNQRGMVVATLIDIQDADRESIEGLYRAKLLKKANVRTFADYTGTKEADIEDMFEDSFYVELVNQEYKKTLTPPLKLGNWKSKAPRILKRIEDQLGKAALEALSFSHYRPSRYFHDNLAGLTASIPDNTKDRFEAAFKDLNKLLPR